MRGKPEAFHLFRSLINFNGGLKLVPNNSPQHRIQIPYTLLSFLGLCNSHSRVVRFWKLHK